jgi:V/A-type H+-transporting ATPase subunit C
MIQCTDDTRYAYVNGIVRAKEARLLTKSHVDRLIAADLSNFNTILADTPYGGYEDIATGLEKAEVELKQFFDQFCQTPEVSKFIDWPEQMHNLKVKLKQGADELLYPQDATEVEVWPEVLDEVAQFTTEKNPFVLSTNLDKILCKYLSETSQFVPFFSRYYECYFDVENIRSFFRARQFEKSREVFIQVFLPYGSINEKIFIDNLATQHDLLAKNFFTTPYAYIIDRGSTYIEEHQSFLRLERLCEEMRLGFLLQARRMAFGVEPLFAYYHCKMGEIKKVRQVYWGKLNEVSLETQKESIPDVW